MGYARGEHATGTRFARVESRDGGFCKLKTGGGITSVSGRVFVEERYRVWNGYYGRERVDGRDLLAEPKGSGTNAKGERIGFNTMVYSESEVDRIAKVAFEIAQKRGGRLCSVEKSNVLEVSQLWKERVIKQHENYKDVELSHMYIDNCAMQVIRDPKQFDTIVTGNIFGDIISDAASMLTGSIGMLPSAAVGSSGPGLYEPVHGSAPDIAGQDKANPLAQVLSAAMLLRYQFGEEAAAKSIEEAVNATLDQGFRTGDIMQEGMKLVGCTQMQEALMKNLSK